MRRRNAFERDFTDLHGSPARAYRVDVIGYGEGPKVDRPGLRILVGMLGLFWGSLLLLVTVGAVVAVVAALWP